MEKMQPGFIEDRITETLLTTVALRALDAQKKHPVLGDKKSIELMGQIDYNFRKFSRGTLMSRVGTNVRGKYFDACARQFIAGHEHPVIVQVGCGLDTRWTAWVEMKKLFFSELEKPMSISIIFCPLSPDSSASLVRAGKIIRGQMAVIKVPKSGIQNVGYQQMSVVWQA